MSTIQQASDFTEQPTLFAIGGSAKKFLQWRTWTKGSTVFFEHGEVDGKKIEHKYTAKPVNEGRANYRDPVAQAQFESNAAWKTKIKEGYFTDLEEAKKSPVIRPMKAHRLDKQGHKLRYPCHGQRKLNGYRCLAIKDNTGYLYLMSSGGETWNVPHIVAALDPIMEPGDMVDGELYIHGVSLQTIGSLVKKNRPESLALEFHLYDMPISGGALPLSWEERERNLRKFMSRYHNYPKVPYSELNPPKIMLTETITLHDENELHRFNKIAIEGGYEGVILRNFGGDYRFKAGCYRSYDVFKHKDFKDSEFKVVDARSRVHSINGKDTLILDVFVCKDNIDGKLRFEVVPKGDIATKAAYWENRERHIGELLTVRYLERSDDGIPQGNPVGLGFRLDEDVAEDAASESEGNMWNG